MLIESSDSVRPLDEPSSDLDCGVEGCEESPLPRLLTGQRHRSLTPGGGHSYTWMTCFCFCRGSAGSQLTNRTFLRQLVAPFVAYFVFLGSIVPRRFRSGVDVHEGDVLGGFCSGSTGSPSAQYCFCQDFGGAVVRFLWFYPRHTVVVPYHTTRAPEPRSFDIVAMH